MGLGIKLSNVMPEGGSTVDDFTLGTVYTFGGKTWGCAEKRSNYIVLVSQGITAGPWPGYKMTGPSSGSGDWGAANTDYHNSIDRADINTYNTAMSTLYSTISAAEYTSATYGKGFYLVGTNKTGTEAYSSITAAHKYYRDPLKAGATWGSAGWSYAWTGTIGYNNLNPYWVYEDGTINTSASSSSIQTHNYVLCPAFNLDPSKVKLDGTTITLL